MATAARGGGALDTTAGASRRVRAMACAIAVAAAALAAPTLLPSFLHSVHPELAERASRVGWVSLATQRGGGTGVAPGARELPPSEFEVACAARAARGRRRSQEDVARCYFGNTDDTRVAAVLDGHFGAEAALLVADELPGLLAKELSSARDGEVLGAAELSHALSAAFKASHASFVASHHVVEDGSPAGATAAAVAVRRDGRRMSLGVATLGDARAVLCSPLGKAKELVASPSPSDAAEQERIRAAGGEVVRMPSGRMRLQMPGSDALLAVSRAVGDVPFGEVVSHTAAASGFEFDIDDSEWDNALIMLVSDGVLEATDMQTMCDVALAASMGRRFRRHASVSLPQAVHAADLVALGPGPDASADAGATTMGSSQVGADASSVESARGSVVPIHHRGIPPDPLVEEAFSLEDELEASSGAGAAAAAVVSRALIDGSLDNLGAVAITLGQAGANARRGSLLQIPSATSDAAFVVAPRGASHAYELMSRIYVMGEPDAPTGARMKPQSSSAAVALPASLAVALSMAEDGAAEGKPPFGQVERDEVVALLDMVASDPRRDALGARAQVLDDQQRVLPDSLEGGYLGVVDATYGQYSLRDKPFAAGSFGEVWRAGRRALDQPLHSHWRGADADGSESSSLTGDCDTGYVLKRLLNGADRDDPVGLAASESGRREAYFGMLLRNLSSVSHPPTDLTHIARFVESFETPGDPSPEAPEASAAAGQGASATTDVPPPDRVNQWLVFCDEGASLASLMYSSAQGDSVVGPNSYFEFLKRSQEWRGVQRDLVQQLLEAVATLHAHGIAHRDLKPANVLIRWEATNPVGSDADPAAVRIHARIADFGSAIDAFTLSSMYEDEAPSDQQQTMSYAPPEARFATAPLGDAEARSRWRAALDGGGGSFAASLAAKYDMFSVGVLMLELALGHSNVFEISPRTRARLVASKGQRHSEAEVEAMVLLRGMMEACVWPPREDTAESASGEGDGAAPAASSSTSNTALDSFACSDAALMEMYRARDAIGVGFVGDVEALRLARKLLSWRPSSRPTAREALEHPYFAGGVQ